MGDGAAMLPRAKKLGVETAQAREREPRDRIAKGADTSIFQDFDKSPLPRDPRAGVSVLSCERILKEERKKIRSTSAASFFYFFLEKCLT